MHSRKYVNMFIGWWDLTVIFAFIAIRSTTTSTTAITAITTIIIVVIKSIITTTTSSMPNH